MTEVEKLAGYLEETSYENLTSDAVSQLKLRVLDSLGVMLGALGSDPIQRIRTWIEDWGGSPRVSLVGGGWTTPERAAFYQGALVRYLDFNDSYVGQGETCHPSDNLAPVLAASEFVQANGKEFLTALALSYQVQIQLSDAVPVRNRGFDHVTHAAYSMASGVAKALRLERTQIAHAIAMSGVSGNPLRVTRTGSLSNWKGLAAPFTAMTAMTCCFLAKQGLTGPLEIFEGDKGLLQVMGGKAIPQWNESFQVCQAGQLGLPGKPSGLESINKTILKKYNAEIHSQSTLEALLELKQRHSIQASDVSHVDIKVFQVAYDIIGGETKDGRKKAVRTKEDADHSLPYLSAVALIDGKVGPHQFDLSRILGADVQALMQKIRIQPDPTLSAHFPHEMPVAVRVELNDGRIFETARSDYEGFISCPMSETSVVDKFHAVSEEWVDQATRDRMIDLVSHLETIPISKLTYALRTIDGKFRTSFKMQERQDTGMASVYSPGSSEGRQRAFSFIPLNDRPKKPRDQGLTEIRGPYYQVMGQRLLADVLETMGPYVDGLKFAGGSFALMASEEVKRLIDLAHCYDVYVSTGGWIEKVLTLGHDAVDSYIQECRALGFDMIEVSMGFITLPMDDFLRVVEKIAKLGIKVKPELGIQFGAGGATATRELEAEGTRDVGWLVAQAKRCLNAGASMLMIESEGITESVSQWRTDVISQVVDQIGLEHVMFEAADPSVFEWYVKNYGPNVNLFVDSSQIVQLEALRSGIWGTKSTWGRIVGYNPGLTRAPRFAPAEGEKEAVTSPAPTKETKKVKGERKIAA